MKKFPKSVFLFYSNNFWRYSGAFILLYSLLSIIDVAGLNLLSSFFLKKTVFILENTSANYVLNAIIPVAISYLFLRGGQWIASILRWTVFDNCIRYKSYNKISSDLYEYLFQQSIEFYSSTMPGKISSQINQISDSFYDSVGTIFGDFLAVCISVIIAATGLAFIGWEYTLLIMFAVLFRVIWGVSTVKKSLNTASERANTLNALQGKLLDAISNFTVVKLFARAKQEQKSVAPARKNYEIVARRAHFWSRFFWAPGNLVMDTICFTLLIILCGYMYSIGRSSIADISFAITIYAATSILAFNLIMVIKNFIDKWGNAVGSYNNLIKPITIQDIQNAPKLKIQKGKIEIRNVSFKYQRKLVLNDLSITINPGEKIGLVGTSGAGKTTLVNLLMRFYDPTNGSIYIDGQNIKEVTQDSLRENIAFIPQDTTIFNRTIKENIAYGRVEATDNDIRKAAKRASADKFINESVDKYNSLVGDRGIKLSGGQRQRIAIARAFLKNAPILILDEATAALDSETETVIQNSFEELSCGRTTIAIAHRLSTLRNMDRIIVIDHGKIIENGTHLQLLRKKNGIYAHLWEMQSGGFIQE